MSQEPVLKLADLIKSFDRHVRAKEFAVAIQVLSKLLPIVEHGKEGFGGTLADVRPASETEATILASALTTLLADKDFKMSGRHFRIFANFKRALAQVFEISGYRGTGHLVDAIGSVNEEGNLGFEGFELPKLFAGLSINAMTPALLGLLKRQKAVVSFPMLTGFLSEQVLWSPHAENARSELVTWSDLFKELDALDPRELQNFGPAYMGCSYADTPNKHDIKKGLNAQVRKTLEKRGVTDIDISSVRRAVKRRPTLVIMAELYHGKHAMHRCYGPSIASLKERFKTIYMSPSGDCDPAVTDLFDKVDDTKFNAAQPEAFINKCKSYRPDIVYFPSIGMRLASIVTSNVRMAPIQVMTFGHPATTYSKHIDYAILDKEQVGDPYTVNETILCRSSVPRFELRADAEKIDPNVRVNPETVRIAVPAWSRKITPNFIHICKKIQAKANKSVEFCFFPNGMGPLYQTVARRLTDMLPCKVYPRTNYNQYIEWLNECDIFLSTFPFGATNGLVDAMRQGLPVVNLTGPEVHAANDSHIVKRFDQPAWLTADSEASYVDAVVKLVNDDKLRCQISQSILACDPDSRLIAQDEGVAKDFADVMEAAYRFHEEIQKKNEKLWSYDRLQEMLATD